MKKGLKKSIFLIVILIVGFVYFQTNIFASNKPQIRVIDASTQVGNYTTASVYASDFLDVAAIDVIVFYDVNYFELISSEISYDLGQKSDVTVVFNDNIEGQVRMTIVAPQGLTFYGYLANIQFRVKEATPINSYPILLAVGEAYNLQNQTIEIDTNAGYIHVLERLEYTNTIVYYESINQTSLKRDDIVIWNIYSYNVYDMTAGMYEMIYDHNVLELISIDFGNGLDGALKNINDQTPGRILLAFISEDGINYANPLISIQLKVIENEQTTTNLQFIPRQIYDENLESLGGNRITRAIQISETITEPDKTKMSLTSYLGKALEEINVKLVLESESNISSAELVINYDVNVLTLTNIETLAEDIFIVYNHDENNGSIAMSLISIENITENIELIHLVFQPNNDELINTNVTLSGNNIYDSDLNAITLDFVNSNIEFNEYAYPFGDLNQDNILSVLDLVMMDLYLNGYLELSDLQMKLFDINLDNTLDINDFEFLLNKIATQ